MKEPDHDIGNLHPSVVDVVLNIDCVPSRSQQADESVAEDGVSQMPNVRSLVGIDSGVLNQDFAADVSSALIGMIGNSDRLATRKCARGEVPFQSRIDVTGARDFQLLESFGQRQCSDNLLDRKSTRLNSSHLGI